MKLVQFRGAHLTPPSQSPQTRILTRLASLIAIAALTPNAHASIQGPSNSELADVVVTATLRPITTLEIPGSVTALDAETLQKAGQQHLQDVLALIPNLNWAGDTSRPRYFQIRGIGELEQYQGAPNPSIGFLIDDIDFSGLGSAATLFDIDQIDVLRGPQGTRYGANALGGLIYVSSQAPSREWGGQINSSTGNSNTHSIGAVLTGPVEALDSSFRLAAQQFTSDGFYRNAFLKRDNTNNRDEGTLRARWRYQPSDDLRIDLTLLHLQMDNGYDAFSPINTRITYSNQPSVDQQHSTGLSIHSDYSGLSGFTLTTLATYAKTRVKYGYDGDWGNATYWAPYSDNFTELQFRNRETTSAEIRLASNHDEGRAWLIGAYTQQLHETLSDLSQGYSNDPINGAYAQDSTLTSNYHAHSVALFAVLDGLINSRWQWSAGLRGEYRSTQYADLTYDATTLTSANNNFSPTDRLWGGHLSLTVLLTPESRLYTSLTRGYKANGFNLSQGIPSDQLLFKSEADWGLESGYKGAWWDQKLRFAGDIFALSRSHAQIKNSYQSDPNNPNTFVYYTGNALSGFNHGAEASLDWQASEHLALGTAIGWLHTAFHDFTLIGSQAGESVSRGLANAPSWQGSIHATFKDPNGIFARLDVTGMGAYYFDLPPNNTRSAAYGLINAKVGFETTHWSIFLWSRNLTNKDYAVRGFYFGLIPPNYAPQLFTQLGEPRTVGIDLQGRFGAR